jgi:hypothetical protein
VSRRPLPKYVHADFVAFLHRVDGELTEPSTLIVIGGGALSLAYVPGYATGDLDLWQRPERRLQEALARVAAELPRAGTIPYDVVGIATAPIDFEERLIRVELGFANLTVVVPERHDLALLKTGRAEAHDLDGLYGLHKVSPLEIEVLCERYQECLTQVIGPVSTFRLNFLALIGRLFGEDVANQMDQSEVPRPPRSG